MPVKHLKDKVTTFWESMVSEKKYLFAINLFSNNYIGAKILVYKMNQGHGVGFETN